MITITKRNILLGAIFLLAILASGVSPVKADDKTDPTAALTSTQQLVCNKRSEVMKNLAANYKEVPTALGMSSNGGVLEVMTSKDGNTWTVLLTKTDGTSCLVAMGNSWENVKFIAAGPNT